MIDIRRRIVVVHELEEVHQVIALKLVSIGLVRMGDIRQGKWHFTDNIAEIPGNIGIPQERFVEPLVNIEIDVLIRVLSAEQARDTRCPAEIENGVFIDDRYPVQFPDIELFVRRPADFARDLARRHLPDGIDTAIVELHIAYRAGRGLLPPPVPEIPGKMTWVFMHIIDPEIIVIGIFIVIPPFERQQEIVFLYKLQLLSRDIRLLLVRDPYIFLRETIDRLIVDRISAAYKILPFLVLETVGAIRLRIKSVTEMRGGPPPQSEPESFNRVKAVKGAGRTDLHRTGLFIPRKQKGRPVHQPAERLHMFQTVHVRVDLTLVLRKRIGPVRHPKTVGLGLCAIQRHRSRPLEDAVRNRRVGLKIQEGDYPLTIQPRPRLVHAKIPQHIALRQQIPAVRLTGKVLVDVHPPDKIEVDAFTYEQPQFLNGIVPIERDPHRPAEQQVLGVPRPEAQSNELLTIDQHRILYKIHVEGRPRLGYRAQEQVGEDGNIIVVDIEI